MKIVKFKDGTYGLKKFGPFGFEFADLRDANIWWNSDSYYRLDYSYGTLKEVESIYKEHIKKIKKLKDKGIKIKEY
jgi:hypothetical protein